MLNNPALYIHFWVILISLPNLIVITLMLLVFILALFVPFPGKHQRQGGKQ